MSRAENPAYDGEAGVALPTALLAMMVLLMLGTLFVAYANPQQQATATSVNREVGLMVAESAAELAVAAIADPEQTDQPFVAPDSAPTDRDAARDWAIDHALDRVTSGCGSFQSTAGGDGVAIVDEEAGSIYGVAFVPDCETRSSVRVMRLAFDSRPLVPLSGDVGILTGGDIYFDHSNARIQGGGIHSNGDIIGTPGDVNGPYSASGSCSDSDCTSGAARKAIPNYRARDFWDQRNEQAVNPNNDPFYELCHDGTVRVSEASAEAPCVDATSSIVPSPGSGWEFSTSGGTRTWTWTSNAGPPSGQYYAYRSNIVNEMNNGNGNSSRISLFAEATTEDLTSSPGAGSTAGSITFTSNPKFFASWPGVGVVADVDVMIERNLRADGQLTLVFAREQFRIDFNGVYERILFIACDASIFSYDEDDTVCEPDATGQDRDSGGSPISTTRITQNARFDASSSGEAIVPNLSITGVGTWEAF